MPELVEPTASLHDAWTDAHEEWGPGAHEDGFGLGPSDDVTTLQGFEAWVSRMNSASEPHDSHNDSHVAATFRWIIEDGNVLGGIALRHGDNDVTKRLGHIGFGITPSARRRGIATWALGCMLEMTRSLGMERVLLICDDENLASARTIEALGGVLDDDHDIANRVVRRYWVDTYPARRFTSESTPS